MSPWRKKITGSSGDLQKGMAFTVDSRNPGYAAKRTAQSALKDLRSTLIEGLNTAVDSDSA